MVGRSLVVLQCLWRGGGGARRFSSPSLVLLHSARHDFSKSGWGSAGVFGSVGLKAGELEAGEGLTALWD